MIRTTTTVRKTITSSALCACLAGALVLGGCGGSSDPDTSELPTTTNATAIPSGSSVPSAGSSVVPFVKTIPKADFIKKADKICSDANAKLPDKPKPVSPSDPDSYSPEEVEAWMKAVILNNRAQFTAIKALGVPDPGGEEFAAFDARQAAVFDSIEKQIPEIKDNVQLLFDPPLVAKKEAMAAAAVAFGFKECGKVV